MKTIGKRLQCPRNGIMAVRVVALTFVAIVASGCALTHTEPICPPGQQTSIVLVALTSQPSIESVRESAASISHQVAQRAASDCAVLSTGVADANPSSDMALNSISLLPTAKNAPDRTPWISELQARAERWLNRYFIGPLRRASPSSNSPVLNTLTSIASQEKAAGRHAGTVVEITDAVAVETAPDGALVNLSQPTDAELAAHQQSFVPGLTALKGGCVLIVDAGAGSGLGLQRLEQARRSIDDVLDAKDIGLAWTRSQEVPGHCRE